MLSKIIKYFLLNNAAFIPWALMFVNNVENNVYDMNRKQNLRKMFKKVSEDLIRVISIVSIDQSGLEQLFEVKRVGGLIPSFSSTCRGVLGPYIAARCHPCVN